MKFSELHTELNPVNEGVLDKLKALVSGGKPKTKDKELNDPDVIAVASVLMDDRNLRKAVEDFAAASDISSSMASKIYAQQVIKGTVPLHKDHPAWKLINAINESAQINEAAGSNMLKSVAKIEKELGKVKAALDAAVAVASVLPQQFRTDIHAGNVSNLDNPQEYSIVMGVENLKAMYSLNKAYKETMEHLNHLKTSLTNYKKK